MHAFQHRDRMEGCEQSSLLRTLDSNAVDVADILLRIGSSTDAPHGTVQLLSAECTVCTVMYCNVLNMCSVQCSASCVLGKPLNVVTGQGTGTESG